MRYREKLKDSKASYDALDLVIDLPEFDYPDSVADKTPVSDETLQKVNSTHFYLLQHSILRGETHRF